MVENQPVEDLKLNTKDVFLKIMGLFDLRGFMGYTNRTLLQAAKKMGLATEIDYCKEYSKPDHSCLRQLIIETVKSSSGMPLSLEEMLKCVPIKSKEFVECLYLAKGSLQEALDIMNVGKDAKKEGRAPLRSEYRENVGENSIARKSSLYRAD